MTERPLVAVLDYGIGNLRSAQKALERCGADARLTADRGLIADAQAVVLPGVGAFGACMDALHAAGLYEIAQDAARDDRPFLGICVGMQMLFEGSDESPGSRGLGVLAGQLHLLPDTVKRPQMQWNVVDVRPGATMFNGIDEPIWMYFVHSYAAESDAEGVIATCQYGRDVAAAVETPTLWATQFHPEKSGRVGLELLQNFVAVSQS